jgi:serine/threonine protein kinase
VIEDPVTQDADGSEELDDEALLRDLRRRGGTQPEPVLDLHFGPYRQAQLIARGGMSLIYRALDPEGRPVAVKVCRLRSLLPFFRREAEALRSCTELRLAGIPTLLAAELEHEPAYLVTPFLGGGTLRQHLRHGRLIAADFDVLFQEGIQLLRSLSQAGLIHGDIKPENILLDESGRLWLVDLGLARRLISKAQTVSSAVTGYSSPPVTAAYMAPEQARGDEISAASDLFSLAITLYEAASGVHPFTAATPWATAARILSHQPAPLHSLRPDLPEAMCSFIDGCLAKQPEARPSLEQAPASASLAKPPAKRRGALFASLAFLLLACLGLAALVNWPKDTPLTASAGKTRSLQVPPLPAPLAKSPMLAKEDSDKPRIILENEDFTIKVLSPKEAAQIFRDNNEQIDHQRMLKDPQRIDKGLKPQAWRVFTPNGPCVILLTQDFTYVFQKQNDSLYCIGRTWSGSVAVLKSKNLLGFVPLIKVANGWSQMNLKGGVLHSGDPLSELPADAFLLQ